MVSPNDWRLHGQEKYLKGIVIQRKSWTETREGWDHDHCSFCGEKFADERIPDALKEGYTDNEEYYWICDTCFIDFKDLFDWVIVEASSEARRADP
jgi:hypothetical protein